MEVKIAIEELRKRKIFVATILKELWDFQSDKHSFSLKDIMYGLVGWGVAILVLV